MPIPVFWRLVSGYVVILVMSVGLSSYSIVQLGGLSAAAREALNVDNRVIAYEEKMTDAFLSEVRYAGRFLITHADALHDEIGQFKSDFARYMSGIQSLTTSPDIKARLARVGELHLRYHDLLDQEVRYVKARQTYAESRYQQERNKILESALRELESFKAQLQNNLHGKLETMERAARLARIVAVIATLVLLALSIALSLVVSNSITAPLAELRGRTMGELADDSDAAQNFFRIPEIQALSDALATAKRKLAQSADTNAAFVNSITAQLGTPLISLKKRLDYLQEELATTITAGQKTTFDILAEETDRLIRHCAQLQTPPTNPAESKNLPKPSPDPGSQPPQSYSGAHLGSAGNAFWRWTKRVTRLVSEHGCALAVALWNSSCQSSKPSATERRKNHEAPKHDWQN